MIASPRSVSVEQATQFQREDGAIYDDSLR